MFQLVRGDEENANKDVRRDLKCMLTRKGSVAQMSRAVKQLKVVPIKMHGQAVESPIDNIALHTLIYLAQSALLSPSTFVTLEQVTAADGSPRTSWVP